MMGHGKFFFVAGFVCLTALLSERCLGAGVAGRPFRLEVLTLNPEIDHIKPLAMADTAGWAAVSDTLIGSFYEQKKDETWIGGFNLATGRVIWWIKGSGTMMAPPTPVGSWVILGFRDGKVVKAETATGKKVWEANLDSFANKRFLLSGATLISMTAAQVLYALDFQTGKPLWLYDGGFPDTMPINSGAAPIVYNDQVIIGVSSGEIHAVNLKTGKLTWKFNPSFVEARFHDVVGELVVLNQNIMLLTRYDGVVAAVDLSGADRTVIWQERLATITTSHFSNGILYVGGLNGGEVTAFEGKSGKKLWRVELGDTVSVIAEAEGSLYVAGGRGRVTALDAFSGAQLWHDDLGGSIMSNPLFIRNGVYFATSIKNLYGYSLSRGPQ